MTKAIVDMLEKLKAHRGFVLVIIVCFFVLPAVFFVYAFFPELYRTNAFSMLLFALSLTLALQFPLLLACLIYTTKQNEPTTVTLDEAIWSALLYTALVGGTEFYITSIMGIIAERSFPVSFAAIVCLTINCCFLIRCARVGKDSKQNGVTVKQ